jgi:hypothetical protein
MGSDQSRGGKNLTPMCALCDAKVEGATGARVIAKRGSLLCAPTAVQALLKVEFSCLLPKLNTRTR